MNRAEIQLELAKLKEEIDRIYNPVKDFEKADATATDLAIGQLKPLTEKYLKLKAKLRRTKDEEPV